MSTKQKLEPIEGGRWAISRMCDGDSLCLIERTRVNHEDEVFRALLRLGLPIIPEVIDRYFPLNNQGERCPTFALMSLWYDLAPATIQDSQTRV